MKKFLFVLSLVMVVLSFQASAATFTLTDTANNIVDSGPDSVVASEKVSGTFSTGWNFTSSANGTGDFRVEANPNLGSLTFLVNLYDTNGTNLVLSLPLNGLDKAFTWSFLANTPLYVEVTGSSAASTNISLSVNGINAVPVPAAVWLFGSALMGLMGVSRRTIA